MSPSGNTARTALTPEIASYLSALPLPPDFTLPTNDLHELLHALATRIGAVRSGGELDLEAAQRFFLRSFQEGKFGAWTLDNLLAEDEEEEEVPHDGQTPPTPIRPPPASEITSLVSARVRTFLDEQSREQARRAEGIAESATQVKKQERARTTAERAAKWEAKLARRAAGGGGTGKGRLTRSTPEARRR